MTLAIDDGDAGGGLRLTARIPEPLDEARRRERYDRPLAALLRDACPGASVRGASRAGAADDEASAELEVTVTRPADVTLVLAHLLELGAPPATEVEVETDRASMSFKLGGARAG